MLISIGKLTGTNKGLGYSNVNAAAGGNSTILNASSISRVVTTGEQFVVQVYQNSGSTLGINNAAGTFFGLTVEQYGI